MSFNLVKKLVMFDERCKNLTEIRESAIVIMRKITGNCGKAYCCEGECRRGKWLCGMSVGEGRVGQGWVWVREIFPSWGVGKGTHLPSCTLLHRPTGQSSAQLITVIVVALINGEFFNLTLGNKCIEICKTIDSAELSDNDFLLTTAVGI